MYTRQWALDRRLKAFQETIAAPNTYALRKSWSAEVESLVLSSRRSQFISDEIDYFKYRVIEMSIVYRERTLAIALFREWSLTEGYFPGHEYFVKVADAITQQDYEMAEFVASCWDEDDHPLYYGNIVLFDWLSIAEPSPLIWPCLLKGIDRQFSRNGSLMVLKAFPLEFEGRIEDGMGSNIGDGPEFDLRQAAMKRLYRRRLGMNDSVGEQGKDGWMWRTMRPIPDFG